MNPRLLYAAALLSPLSLAMLLRSPALGSLTTPEYSPRREQYLAHPWLLWTNVGTNLLVSLSYLFFILGIFWLVRRLRSIPELRNNLWILFTLNIFFLARLATTVLSIAKVWWPLYNFTIVLNIVCVVTSLPAAAAFIWRAPALAANITRFFHLLASEKNHAEALRKSEEFLDRTNRLAGVGGWELDLATGAVHWSAETHRIHGAPPEYTPSLAEGLNMYKPEARPLIAAAVENAIASGEAWDLELPVTTLDGRDIWARSVGVAELRDGRAIRLVGAFQDVTSIVETRNALSQASERIEIAADSGGIGIWDWDIVSGALFCDERMYRLHGKDPRSPSEDGVWRDHLHPEDKDRVVQALGDAVAGVRPYDTEFRILWPDGSVHHLRGSARVTRDSDGNALRMVGVNWDVTAMVEARNALRLANERAALATDSGGIGIFAWDFESGLCTCDDWMYRLHDLEKTSESTPLEFWTQHMHPDDVGPVLHALNAAIAGPEPYNTEYRVVWRDGSVHHLRGTGKIARNKDGKAVSMIGTNWDVTEFRRLTAQLSEQHELLHITLQSIGDGVITTDSQRNVAWLNPAAERMTGWATADAIGQPIGLIFKTLNEDTREPVENPLAHHIAQGKAAGIARNTLLISRDGTEFGIENSVAPIRNTFGDLLGNVLVFRDVTEQRRLAAETDRNTQLKMQLRLKDEFLSHVSHELRSPLSSIYSFTSIIADNLAGETTPEQADYLHIILKNVTQLQSMIEDLLTVTQSREGKLTIEPRSISVEEAITDSLHTAQGAAAAKHIDLSYQILDALPPAYADPIRLRQILIILLDNAIKFTPPEGRIAVTASCQDSGMLLVQVSDTGCGIPPAKRALVFENLYQVREAGQSDTSQAGRTGLGLGLHIARNLVTRQGGKIWVTEATSTGSIFHFTLPAFVETATSPSELDTKDGSGPVPTTAQAA